MPLNVPVILGTVRSERVGPRVARYLVRALEQRGHHPTLIDPVEYPLPLLDKMYKEYPAGSSPNSSGTRTPSRRPAPRGCRTERPSDAPHPQDLGVHGHGFAEREPVRVAGVVVQPDDRLVIIGRPAAAVLGQPAQQGRA